ncbi:MAG: histidinolphosphatase [Bogoriella megaspora]|nr:MAG: histidinolphosphatase [Bogoriella megaspora]
MPFTHHSHSGQFCGHAKDTLEQVVQTALEKKMQVLALTEHMPRDVEDLYPGETETLASLTKLYDDFHAEAVRLRAKYKVQIEILIGFEIDWIRPGSLVLIQDLLDKHPVDLFVGSVHHVHTIPIDFDKSLYEKARSKSGGKDQDLFRDYFDAQYEMLQALKPPVIGHFDLIRLYSEDANQSFVCSEKVWSKILRNLRFIRDYGGLVELNSSALRKGMNEPYPKVEICKAFLELGGRFTLSDDSHGTDQVALNYPKVLQAIKESGIQHIHFLQHGNQTFDVRMPSVEVASLPVDTIENHTVFQAAV